MSFGVSIRRRLWSVHGDDRIWCGSWIDGCVRVVECHVDTVALAFWNEPALVGVYYDGSCMYDAFLFEEECDQTTVACCLMR